MKIYYPMIYSYLRYCFTTWGSASKTTLMPLVKLQKRIVRIMKGCDYRNHTKPIFQEMKLLTLSVIYFLETAKFMHRIHYKQYNLTSTSRRQQLQFTNTTQNTVIKITITSYQLIFSSEKSNKCNWPCNLVKVFSILEKIFT